MQKLKKQLDTDAVIKSEKEKDDKSDDDDEDEKDAKENKKKIELSKK